MKECRLLTNYGPSSVYAFFPDSYFRSQSSSLESMVCGRTSTSMTRCKLHPFLHASPATTPCNSARFMDRELMVLYYRLPTGETLVHARNLYQLLTKWNYSDIVRSFGNTRMHRHRHLRRDNTCCMCPIQTWLRPRAHGSL